MATRHLIIGGGTAGLNAIRTIREEGAASEITLVSRERPYSRMVLPYYLGASIAESHVYTATPASLSAWGVKSMLGRRAARLEPAERRLTLDDGTTVEYDDCLIATGSRAARPPIPGADGPGVHSFWTLEEARAVIAGVQPGTQVVMVGTNLEWLDGSGIEVSAEPGGGILVDDHLRSSVKNVYAAGDVARGSNLLTGMLEVHAIEPTAQEHGRVVGANMAGRDVAYRGSLLMNIVEVCHLDIASFGQWDDPKADVYTATRADRSQYRKLLFRGSRLTGAMICGPAEDIWTTNDVGMLKGLVYAGTDLQAWKAHLKKNPFDIKPAFLATHTVSKVLPLTVLGRASQSPQLPQSVMVQ